MYGRDLELLREMREQVSIMHHRLANKKPFQHPRISLPVGEAVRKTAELEQWLTDIVETVEAELYSGPK